MADGIGVVGASGYVGRAVMRLAPASGLAPVGFSRRAGAAGLRRLAPREAEPEIPLWIDIAPIWTFAERAAIMESYGAARIVARSSTSRFTKTASGDAGELALARQLADGEARFIDWCAARGIGWIILRPTIIYGAGDRNVREIAGMIRRFGFFPLFGAASGRRQPIHAEDLACACLQAARAPVAGKAYAVSGAEILTYREMVERIFAAMGRRPVTPSIPLGLFAAACAVLRRIPRFRKWTPQMAERMNQDMVFDHAEAARDFGFAPGPFRLAAGDLE